MLKMYHRRAHKGDSPQLWEENWKNNNFDEPSLVGESNPLKPLFDRYALPGTWMLEGGCGHGQYVAYYSGRRVRVVGLDFAQDALRRLRSGYGALMLCSGDVAALPFRDESFDLYYSGGVVEHFEEGAEQALREARRVLRPDGVLLVSVPYVNLLRRVVWPFKSSLWKSLTRAQVDTEPFVEGTQFFQYAYTRPEFEELLAAAGLRVIGTQGYGILWGLYDLHGMQAFVEKVIHRISGRSRPNSVSDNGVSAQPLPEDCLAKTGALSASSSEDRTKVALERSQGQPSTKSTLRRLAVNEDDQLPVLGLGVRLMRMACANMMMYVCVRDGSE